MTERKSELSELERWIASSRIRAISERRAAGERDFWATHPMPAEAAPVGRLIELKGPRSREHLPSERAA